MPARGHTFFGETFPHFPQKKYARGKKFPQNHEKYPRGTGGL